MGSLSISIEPQSLNQAISQFMAIYELGVKPIPGYYGTYVNAKAWYCFIRNTAAEIRTACCGDLAKLDTVFKRYRQAIYGYHNESDDTNIEHRYSHLQTRARSVEERDADLFDWTFNCHGDPSNAERNRDLALSYFRLLGVEANKLAAITAESTTAQPNSGWLAATVED